MTEGNDKETRLNEVLQALEEITFPPLDRPLVTPEAPPTEELVAWQMRFYASCLVSHARHLLRSFLRDVRDGQLAASFVVGRAIFELGAHATLVYTKYLKRQAAGDLAGARDLFRRATMGNRDMRDRRKLTEAGEEWPAPFHVQDAIRAVDDFLATKAIRGDKSGESMYRSLSEHSHPNQGAFAWHYRFEQSSFAARVVFVPVREDYTPPPLSEVDVGMALGLHFSAILFELGGDPKMMSMLQIVTGKLMGRPSRGRPGKSSDDSGGMV